MSRTFLKAAPGLRIRQADGQPWPEAGEYADTADIYIQRRIADGDLVAADAPAADRAEASARHRTNKTEEPAR